MRNVLLTTTALVAFTVVSSAGAADLPVKAPPIAPIVAPAFSWTGCYLGVNAGGAWGRSNLNFVPFGGPLGAQIEAAETPNLRPNSFTGGGEAGCNYQSGNIVFGFEADFDYFGLRAAQSTTSLFNNGTSSLTATNSVKTDWLFTARPRLGYAWDSWLLYVTGGVAVTNMRFASDFSNTIGDQPVSENASSTKAGWTFGGGVEVALNRNWSAKVEYLYIDFGSLSTSVVSQGALFGHNVPLTAQIARVGLNYKFDWGSPVVARY
jgi:outer membrane immunogenic protein